jgi:two-component system sensor histidine kinase CssS
MKKYSLSTQMMFGFTIIMLLSSIAIIMVLPYGLHNQFETSVTHQLESIAYQAQHTEVELPIGFASMRINKEGYIADFLDKTSELRKDSNGLFGFFKKDEEERDPSTILYTEFYDSYKDQEVKLQTYETDIDNMKIYYTILNYEIDDHFLVIFTVDQYISGIINSTVSRIILFVLIIYLQVILVTFVFTKYMTVPLKRMTQYVKKLGNGEWDKEMLIHRYDEIGELALSINQMRIQLLEKDQQQKEMLHNISHDLKTPIMVIQSYLDAIRDGFYPAGTLEDTLDVAYNEAKRLEKKVKQLLYLNRFDYLEELENPQTFDLKELATNVVNRMKINRKDLDFQIMGVPHPVVGDEDHWKILLENIIDNFMRYAHHSIQIGVMEREIVLYNDGPHISEELIHEIFNAYRKGSEGEFGLGLAIVHKIATKYGYMVEIENAETGVIFRIKKGY